MNRMIVLGAAMLALSACGSGRDADPAPKPKATPTAPARIAFDPALVGIAGTWTSPPGSLGTGRYLRVDVASGGGYTVDVRIPGKPEQVVETGRGKVTLAGGTLSATPDAGTKGADLTKLGAWRATSSGSGDARTLSLKGADGRSLKLSYKGL